MEEEEREVSKVGLGLGPDTPSYFDVFVYLADQQMVDVDLLVDAPSAGLLDKDKGVQHFCNGDKMTVTLAAAAALQNTGLAKVKKPDNISAIASKSTHTPDACCLLDLRSVCPVFFEYATRLAYLTDDDEMFTVVQKILRERMKKLAGILESECLKTAPPRRTHPLNASVAAFQDALKKSEKGFSKSRGGGCVTDLNLEGDTDASRKTFIRGLTLSESHAVEIRKEQLWLL